MQEGGPFRKALLKVDFHQKSFLVKYKNFEKDHFSNFSIEIEVFFILF